MKIAVVAPSPVPFTLGGAERTWSALVGHINTRTTHTAELVKLPSPERSTPEVLASYRAFSSLDLTHFDAIVSSKYPAWMVRHPRHVLYLFHPLRGLYDTYPDHLPKRLEGGGSLDHLARILRSPDPHPTEVLDAADEVVSELGADDPRLALPGPFIRGVVHCLDRVAKSPDRVARHLAISSTVARRPGYFPPGVDVEVLPPPSGLAGGPNLSGRHVLTSSRLDGPKRLDLLIEAYRLVSSDTPLLIAGTGPDEARLRSLALADVRVRLLGFVPDDELARLYSEAIAVPFVPHDEDLGLVTFEAFSYGKPVVTCTDSGGPTEFVRNGESGFVVEPTPEAVASALDRLIADAGLATRLGERGRSVNASLSWDPLIDRIVSAPRTDGLHRTARRRRPRRRPAILALGTYAAFPALGGGQIRVQHLLKAAAEDYDVVLVAVTGAVTRPAVSEPAHGVVQLCLPPGPVITAIDGRWSATLGVPAGDVAAALGATRTASLLDAVSSLRGRVDAVMLPHPYLAPLANLLLPDLPWVHDSHNAELSMKRTLFRPGGDALEALGVVGDAEALAIRRSRVITYCAEADREGLSALGPTLAAWHLVPNGVEVDERPFSSPRSRRRLTRRWLAGFREQHDVGEVAHLALFVGSDHPPNAQAASIILATAPHTPDVVYVLAGSHGRTIDRTVLPRNVVVLGTVGDDDLRRLYAVASVALNPMLSGGGTNLKILEAFACGVPVVTSALGARGIPGDPEEVAWIAEPRDLAAAIRAVVSSEHEADARAAAARRLVERVFDWNVIGDVFRGALAPLSDVGPRRTRFAHLPTHLGVSSPALHDVR